MIASHKEEALKALMLDSLDGDRDAYRCLLSILNGLLLAYFKARLGSASSGDAEDLVQETLLAVHKRRIAFNRDRPFKPWLYAIARYKLVDHHRVRGARAALEAELNDHLAGGFSEEAFTAAIDVDRLLARLPALQGELIRSVKINGNSIEFAARCIGRSEAATKVALHRAMRYLGLRMRG